MRKTKTAEARPTNVVSFPRSNDHPIVAIPKGREGVKALAEWEVMEVCSGELTALGIQEGDDAIVRKVFDDDEITPQVPCLIEYRDTGDREIKFLTITGDTVCLRSANYKIPDKTVSSDSITIEGILIAFQRSL